MRKKRENKKKNTGKNYCISYIMLQQKKTFPFNKKKNKNNLENKELFI